MTDSLNKSTFATYLGVSSQYLPNHPEVMEWVAKQEGVDLEARPAVIPTKVAQQAKKEFKIEPSKTRKPSTASESTSGLPNLSDLHGLVLDAEQAEKVAKEALDGARADLRSAKAAYKSAYNLVQSNLEAFSSLPAPE